VFIHLSQHLDLYVAQQFNHIPGVPAFFFVSGFLIWSSYHNSTLKNYLLNRFLRLFPGLFFVTLGGLALILYSKGVDFIIENASTMTAWLVMQLTLGQSYNPELFRDIGVGVINGSLWTITVEILFYILVPVVSYLDNKYKYSVLLLTLLSYMIYSNSSIWSVIQIGRYRLNDLLSLTPIVWGWMFGFGILLNKHFDVVRKYMSYMFMSIMPMLILIVLDIPTITTTGNNIHILYFICLASLITWFSFGVPAIKLKADYSYGIYVWHMVLINLFIVKNNDSPYVVLFLVILISVFSWHVIERPILRLKKVTINN